MTRVARIAERGGRQREVVLFRSTSGVLYAQSQSHPNVRYCLGADGNTCQCLGYQARHTCKHVVAARMFRNAGATAFRPEPQPFTPTMTTIPLPEETERLIDMLWPGR